MANVVLPRIGRTEQHQQDENFQYKSYPKKARKGPNVPPTASRITREKRYSIVVAEYDREALPDLAVSGVAQQNSLEDIKSDQRKQLLYSGLGYYNERNDAIAEESEALVGTSILNIKGLASKKVGAEDYDDSSREVTPATDTLDPNLVQWEDFNNQTRLEENLNDLLSCKKVILKFDVAKVDYVPGIVAVPIFHCPRCCEQWNRSRKVPEHCEECPEPTRGKPMALDQSASFILFDTDNINFIRIRGRKKFGESRTDARAQVRRKTIMMAFHGDSYPNMNNQSEHGIRKYGGLNDSAAEMLVATDSTNKATNNESGIPVTDRKNKHEKFVENDLKESQEHQSNRHTPTKHGDSENDKITSVVTDRNCDRNNEVISNTNMENHGSIENDERVKEDTSVQISENLNLADDKAIPSGQANSKATDEANQELNLVYIDGDYFDQAGNKISLNDRRHPRNAKRIADRGDVSAGGTNWMLGFDLPASQKPTSSIQDKKGTSDPDSHTDGKSSGSASKKLNAKKESQHNNATQKQILQSESRDDSRGGPRGNSKNASRKSMKGGKPHEDAGNDNKRQAMKEGLVMVNGNDAVSLDADESKSKPDSHQSSRQSSRGGSQRNSTSIDDDVELEDKNNDPNRLLASIDEKAVLNIDLDNQSYQNNATKVDEESPADVLARVKKRKFSVSSKNPAVWNKTGVPEKQNVPLGKHVMSTPGGGGIQQLVDESTTDGQGSQSLRRGSIPVNNEEQYLMQGGSQPVSQRQASRESRNGSIYNSSDKLSMSFNQSQMISKKSEESDITTMRTGSGTGLDSRSDLSSSARQQVRVKKSIVKKERKQTNSKRSSKADYELPPLELSKSTSRPIGSAEILRLNQSSPSGNQNGPSSRLHSSCSTDPNHLDSLTSPKVTPLTLVSDKNTQDNGQTNKRNNIFASRNLFNNCDKKDTSEQNVDRKCSTNHRRDLLTPSPRLSRKISYNELQCLNMRNFTSTFTFSFYDLPDQYRKFNDSLKNKQKLGKNKKKGK